MSTTIRQEETRGQVTSEQVWRALDKASFAVLSYVTPLGEPRSSGVVYKMLDKRLYVAVAPEGWKARHVALAGRVSATVPVRRGGLLSLIAPIPPATVSFHAAARVYPPGSPEAHSLTAALGSLLPKERRASASIIEIVPEGMFVTYAIDVPLRRMRDPEASRARIPAS